MENEKNNTEVVKKSNMSGFSFNPDGSLVVPASLKNAQKAQPTATVSKEPKTLWEVKLGNEKFDQIGGAYDAPNGGLILYFSKGIVATGKIYVFPNEEKKEAKRILNEGTIEEREMFLQKLGNNVNKIAKWTDYRLCIKKGANNFARTEVM